MEHDTDHAPLDRADNNGLAGFIAAARATLNRGTLASGETLDAADIAHINSLIATAERHQGAIAHADRLGRR